jgi:acyl transferase domain-containing protein/NAD(P)-dependent dehydrogenase (short-subunit alcohol dehydrogenase family)
MEDTAHRAIAIVGVGAILPDAPNASAFWNNIKSGRYCISEVTPDRWDSASYYDPDPAVPDKTYSKIGGWVRDFTWDPIRWKLPIPPKVAEAMDPAQRWAIACTREALEDYGYPKRALDLDRTAVILGNAMAGEKHYLSSLRVFFPEYARELADSPSFAKLPADVRGEITQQLHERMDKLIPAITEDTMPGELANCMAGRIANLYNFHGPNFVCDAACASAMAALTAAVEGLVNHDFDAVVTGGIDRNMGAPTFVKFCKIGALSATGTRPYAQGADGFVMGEGAAIFLLKRLADAERDQDKIYAVIRGLAGASDGKGKGITAPNPIGQKMCVERAWQNAGLPPATATLIEGHGTSTKVGDVVETSSMIEVLKGSNLAPHSIALGSVKSNIGHLKGAAGAAGVLKAAFALHEKVLPPSLNCKTTSPDIDFAHSPLYVNTELRPWELKNGTPRRAGVSAFGFGGTNFHVVLEEYVPGRLNGNGKKSIAVPVTAATDSRVPQVSRVSKPGTDSSDGNARKTPLRGALVLGAATEAQLIERVKAVQASAQSGQAPAFTPPAEEDLVAPERVAIDYADAAELAIKCGAALKAFAAKQPAFWKALRAQGIFRGHGPAPKVAFLYTGQGSQYVNMLRKLREAEPVVADTFTEADAVMTPLLGKSLTDIIYVDPRAEAEVAEAEEALRQTAVTQPAVISINIAQTRLLEAYGIRPDMTMGHSVGEYGSLVAAGALPFEDALEAVSARGREMTRVSMKDNGKMAAVFAPIAEVERILKTVDGYVVIANVNSNTQSVIGGATQAVEQASELFLKAGFNVVQLPVSHAFHTSIVAPASEPLKQMLSRLRLQTPKLPIIANINGEFYPAGVTKDTITEMLAQQVASPVLFVKGLRTLYDAGVRVFVEVGPKKALQGFAEDVLGSDAEVFSLFTNHPKIDDVTAFNQALCGMSAAGLGVAKAEIAEKAQTETVTGVAAPAPSVTAGSAQTPIMNTPTSVIAQSQVEPARENAVPTATNGDRYSQLGHLFSEVMERGWEIYKGEKPEMHEPVVVTGAAVGLPGSEHIFDDANLSHLLNGDQFIGAIPDRLRQAMLDKNITRLVKSENGGAVFETIHDAGEVIKLAGRGGSFDLEADFGVSAERVAALDRVTKLAIAAGIDALRDAGIPLVMRYKTTTKGTYLPDRWGLPEAMRDDTGVIFGSAFPGYDAYADIMGGYYINRARREELTMLERWSASGANGHSAIGQEVARRIDELRALLEKEPYVFDRRFLFRVLSMGHSQFAEYIGARGPNTQINAACATTTQAMSLAEDWIRAGRCRRVIVISADDVTSDNMLEWFGAGFLASGAAATDELVQDAATPFDKRRHGLIIGMGAAALVVESADAARERGIRPICQVLGTVTANSAFHGSRLDVNHITQVMQTLVTGVEKRHGISRADIAPKTVFVSHETYTPARGGSASAEIYALRSTFGELANRIVIANTKGYTGHAMATGIEDVLAVKALETGIVPPVPNFKEVDPELGVLNLAKGGDYPIEYALRLGAGFGSQISMTLSRWVKTPDGQRTKPTALGYASRIGDAPLWNEWLCRVTGNAKPEFEVIKRTLRVRDHGPQGRVTTSTKEVKPAVTTPAPVQAAAVAAAPVVEPKPVTAPAVVVTPVAQVVTPTVTTAVEGSVKERILALVVEKTGYPEEMLDLELDMEADLGVDTVKQAEIFAAIREIYGIPRDESRKLRDYPTLAHVIRFVFEKRPDLATSAVASPQQSKKEEVQAAPASAATAPTLVATAPVTAALVTSGNDDVKKRILALVVEKTGYPEEMLDLELDMEADLGVDTVKQAEIFAAIREIYDIPRDESRKLRDYPTLAHVIRFVFEKRPDLAATPAVAEAAAAVTSISGAAQDLGLENRQTWGTRIATTDDVKKKVLALVVEKTGYPEEMLDLDLDMEADLGVDTVKQAEIFASIRALYNIPRDENRKLRDYPTLAHVIRFVLDSRPDLAGEPIVAQTKTATTVVETPAPTPSAAAAEPPRAVATASHSDDVKKRILALVVEKTGYPEEMLDLELDMEADLGVDTVKQAEIFASIRELYNIPRDENRKLRDYPTLAHVIRFVFENRPDLAAPTSTVTDAAPATSTSAATQDPGLDNRQTWGTHGDVTVANLQSIAEKVLDIVAEKTGYPKEMLDPELDLEADLGIDTVKQAEMFASVRAAYNIPRDENLKLRDFPTLAHVIKFAQDRAAASDKPAQTATVTTQAPAKQAAATRPTVELLSFDAANTIPRRVPTPVLRPPLNLCKPTGVTLAAGSRVLVMSDNGGVAQLLCEGLRGKGVDVLCVNAQPSTETLLSTIDTWMKAGPVQGVFWLPAIDNEGPISGLDITSWREAVRIRVKALYATMRKLYEQIAPAGTFLITATRLGGQHGYDEHGAFAPMGGAVSGFTKAYKRERPDATVKAVDFESQRSATEIATLLIDEALRDTGAVEIGYKDGLRWTVGLQEQSATNGQPGLMLNPDSVFVVTGAAGSIVSAITQDLAAASGGTFYLLDLVPEPDAKNPDLARFISDKDGLKRDLFARIQARGERATPAMIERELAGLERANAALSAIRAVQSAGGTAHYFSVNLADAAAVARVIADVRKHRGRIDVLLHAAGLERSHFLPDKDVKEFDLVFDVKADGWFNLLHAIGDMPLGATAGFSSVAGRFGNGGQTDYSAANDLLCKYSSSFRTTRPQTRGIVIDWTAWGGIGMATRGSIPKMMEAAGIDMLAPEAGIPIIRRELTAGNFRGEIVVAQRLGMMMKEFDETGGLDLEALAKSSEEPAGRGPMLGRVTGLGIYTGLTMETTLDPKVQPFLYDHRIDGTPVLPGVMGMEAFAEVASCLHPGWHVEAIEEVNFLAPFKFYKDEPRTVILEATIRSAGGKLVADCRLVGRRKLPNSTEPQETTHFTARVRVAKQVPDTATVQPPQLTAETIVNAAQIYRIYFHGPAYQVLERAWWDGKRVIGKLSSNLPENHKPTERTTLVRPRLIELCFQTAGLWQMAAQGRMGLPWKVEQLQTNTAPKPNGEALYAVVTPHPEAGVFDAEVVDAKGTRYLRLNGYHTIELPDTIDSEQLKELQGMLLEHEVAVS